MNDTAFIIGNGESRLIFDLKTLKGKGTVYGCNAIYRDHADVCDFIMSVNQEMYEEVMEAKERQNFTAEVLNTIQLSGWNYLCDGDHDDVDRNGKPTMRFWSGGDIKTGKIKTLDFTKTKGSGCSAILHAIESGHKNICLLGFDILGAKQWEAGPQEMKREWNNVYKQTKNYPKRVNMKAYLKFEWLYHLRQTARHYLKDDVKIYFFNRKEYVNGNPLLPKFFDIQNIFAGNYFDLKKWLNEEKNKIDWITFHKVKNNVFKF
jgi:hypothetical protein